MIEVANSLNGVQTLIHRHNDGKGTISFGTQQDCTAIVENAKNLQKAGMTGSSEMKHAASIPNVVVDKYCNDNGITLNEFIGNKEHIRRLLNDPAMEYFRIWKGKL